MAPDQLALRWEAERGVDGGARWALIVCSRAVPRFQYVPISRRHLLTESLGDVTASTWPALLSTTCGTPRGE